MVQAIVGAIADLPVLAGPKSVEPEDQRLSKSVQVTPHSHSEFSLVSAMIVIQDDRIGFDIRLLVHHLDWLPEQEGCRGNLCPYPVSIDDGISDIMNSEQGQTGDVNHHRVCFDVYALCIMHFRLQMHRPSTVPARTRCIFRNMHYYHMHHYIFYCTWC